MRKLNVDISGSNGRKQTKSVYRLSENETSIQNRDMFDPYHRGCSEWIKRGKNWDQYVLNAGIEHFFQH